jgi:hypothetical protein
MGNQALKLEGDFNDVLVVRELRGNYPDVKFFDDVDVAELTKGDDDPLYLTIPIGKANVISGNKRFYSEAWLQELERQVKEQRPVGIMGHLSEEEMNSKFPEEAVFWLGVQRVGELLWAKGYIPARSAARDRIRRYKATNKAIGTSIFAKAEGVWNKARGAYDMLAETLQLQQIDIGPADRIGIPALASVPILTAEMQTNEQEQEPEMDKLQVINEMTAEDARLLPDSVRQAVLSSVQSPPEVQQVQEIRTLLGVDDKADLKALIGEMQTTQKEQAKAIVEARVAELAADVKVEDVRGVVVEMVNAKSPHSIEEVNTAFAQVLEMPSIKNLLKTTVVNTMGPSQTTRVQGQEGQSKYFNIPAKGEKENA